MVSAATPGKCVKSLEEEEDEEMDWRCCVGTALQGNNGWSRGWNFCFEPTYLNNYLDKILKLAFLKALMFTK